jgi:preprotein translocase subunit SecE
MSEITTTEAESKGLKKWFIGLRAEFKKIIWPDKKSAAKQVAAVIIISVVLGVLVRILDTLLQLGIKFIA